jgi:hypothetical protein
MTVFNNTPKRWNTNNDNSLQRFDLLLKRATELIRSLTDLVEHHRVKGPGSLNNDSPEVKIQWIAWLKESKPRKLAAGLSEVRQSIAAALTALLV